MGDRAEVSHQTRTSDDHALGLGYRMGDSYTRLQTMSTGLGPMRLLRRAPHLRCGAARFCRWPTSGGGWEGRRAGRRRYGEGAVCVSAPLMVGAYGTGRRTPRGRGHVVAGGDVRRRRGRESCLRTRGLFPAGADRTPPRGMSPLASEAQSSVVAAEACNRHQSRRSPVGRCSGARLEDVERERPPSPSKIHK